MIDANNIAAIQEQIAALKAQAKAIAAADRKEKHRAEVLARRAERHAERKAARELKAERVAELRAMMDAAGISMRDLKAALA